MTVIFLNMGVCIAITLEHLHIQRILLQSRNFPNNTGLLLFHKLGPVLRVIEN
jgi:hypothetical protein